MSYEHPERKRSLVLTDVGDNDVPSPGGNDIALHADSSGLRLLESDGTKGRLFDTLDYADYATMAAATGFTAADVGRGARVTAGSASLELVNHVGPVWGAGNGGRICLWPSGAGDFTMLAACLAARSSRIPGTQVKLMPGTWDADAVVTVPPGIDIVAHKDVRIVGRLAVAAGHEADPNVSLFFAAPTYHASTTTFSATPGVNNHYCSVVSITAPPIAVGDYLEFSRSDVPFLLTIVRVIKITGSGPYTLYLDRPILRTYTNTVSVVKKVTLLPERIRLLGEGAVMTGTCARYIELAGARDCLIQGWTFDDSATAKMHIAASLDCASYRSAIEDCVQNAYTLVADYGLFLETAEECEIRNCRAYGLGTAPVGQPPFKLFDSIRCKVKDSVAVNSTYGVLLGTDTGGSYGCTDITIDGCKFNWIDKNVIAATTDCSRIKIHNCRMERSGNSDTSAIICLCDVDIRNLIGVLSNTINIVAPANTQSSIRDCELNPAAAQPAISNGSAGVLHVNRTIINLGSAANSTGVYINSATGATHLSGVSAVTGASGTKGVAGAGPVTIGAGCDFSGAATPFDTGPTYSHVSTSAGSS